MVEMGVKTLATRSWNSILIVPIKLEALLTSVKRIISSVVAGAPEQERLKELDAELVPLLELPFWVRQLEPETVAAPPVHSYTSRIPSLSSSRSLLSITPSLSISAAKATPPMPIAKYKLSAKISGRGDCKRGFRLSEKKLHNWISLRQQSTTSHQDAMGRRRTSNPPCFIFLFIS